MFVTWGRGLWFNSLLGVGRSRIGLDVRYLGARDLVSGLSGVGGSGIGLDVR